MLEAGPSLCWWRARKDGGPGGEEQSVRGRGSRGWKEGWAVTGFWSELLRPRDPLAHRPAPPQLLGCSGCRGALDPSDGLLEAEKQGEGAAVFLTSPHPSCLGHRQHLEP